MRLGQDYDGGYIVNREDIDKSDILISMGVKDDWSFEMDFSKINDCELVCLDKESQVSSDDVFYTGHRQMIYKNIGLEESPDTISFDILLISNKIFLKMDVEGEEYKFLDLLIQNSHKFSSICMEFHVLMKKIILMHFLILLGR